MTVRHRQEDAALDFLPPVLLAKQLKTVPSAGPHLHPQGALFQGCVENFNIQA